MSLLTGFLDSVPGTPADQSSFDDIRDKYPAGYPIKPNWPDRNSYHHQFDLKLEIKGDPYAPSTSMSLLWALDARKEELYRQLIRSVHERSDESLIEASNMLSELENIDELVRNLAIHLHDLAVRNQQVIAGLNDPSRIREAGEVDGFYQARHLDRMRKLIKS
ncbi:hypothetical protein [Fibrella forsythiae]|uniref:Uncharacterized protein n=1 Tax=Fibrella forsythiae TaxID=2817061 RepID=A0ABS3JB86_9BACT|nr:hypothetical protein [Fibrella forsythiae]MBO0947256.1 hypothetical protein [Fibrella forsythiae]